MAGDQHLLARYIITEISELHEEEACSSNSASFPSLTELVPGTGGKWDGKIHDSDWSTLLSDFGNRFEADLIIITSLGS